MIRCDKNFNTQFETINPVRNIASRNFFVVERAVLDELETKVSNEKMPFNQGMHDELLQYLGKQYKQP